MPKHRRKTSKALLASYVDPNEDLSTMTRLEDFWRTVAANEDPAATLQTLAHLIPARVIRMHIREIKQLAESLEEAESSYEKPYYEEFEAAVLFADISGFSSLASQLVEYRNDDETQAAEDLSRCVGYSLEKMVDCVTALGGDVIRFAGDAVLAVFAAESYGGSLSRATATCCTAALRLTELDMLLANKKPGNRASGLPQGFEAEISVHCGIGAGTVRSAKMGGYHDRWEYVVSGKPVEEMGLAEPQANSGEVVISETARSLLADGGYEPIGASLVPLKSTRFEDFRLDSLRHSDYKVELYDVSAELQKLNIDEAKWLAKFLRCYVMRTVLWTMCERDLYESQLRHCSTMFVKIGGLEITQRKASPESILSELQEIFSKVICTTIADHNGAVCRFIFDDKGAVCLIAFGLPPFMNENDSVRSVRAACAIVRAMQEVNIARLARKTFKLTCQIGIARGRVSVGTVGSTFNRCEYTLHGVLVNLAARLMTKASNMNKSILVDDPTYKLSEKEIEYEAPMDVEIKGMKNLVRVRVPLGDIQRFSLPRTPRRESFSSSSSASRYPQPPKSPEKSAPQPSHMSPPIPIPNSAQDITRSLGTRIYSGLKNSVSKTPPSSPVLTRRRNASRVTSGGHTTPSSSSFKIVPPAMREQALNMPVLDLTAAQMRESSDAVVEDEETVVADVEPAQSKPIEDDNEDSSEEEIGASGYGVPIEGREKELIGIQRQLDKLCRHSSEYKSVMIVIAEAGYGKSRLIKSVIDRNAAAQKIEFFVGYGIDSSTSSFASWRTFLAQLVMLSIGSAELLYDALGSFEGTQDLFENHVLELLPSDLRESYPLLQGLLGEQFPALHSMLRENEFTSSLRGETRGNKLSELLVKIVARASKKMNECEGRRMCLVVEDLMWMDANSVLVLHSIIKTVDRVAVIATTRYVEDPNLEILTAGLPSSLLHKFSLELLSREDVARAMNIWLGVDSVPKQAVDALYERSSGNPLYAEELCRWMIEEKNLEVKRRVCTMPVVLSLAQLPDTISSIITSRLDKLSPSVQYIVKVASIIPNKFQQTTIKELMYGEDETSVFRKSSSGGESSSGPRARLKLNSRLDFDRSFEELVSKNFFEEIYDANDGMRYYKFAHAILKETAYNLLPYDTRARFHHKIAEFIEQRTDHLEVVFSQLADHYYLAEHWKNAILYLELAGDQAISIYGTQIVYSCFSRLLHIYETQKNSNKDVESIATLRIVSWGRKAGAALIQLGDYRLAEERLTYALRMLKLAPSDTDVGRKGRDHSIKRLASSRATSRAAADDKSFVTRAVERLLSVCMGPGVDLHDLIYGVDPNADAASESDGGFVTSAAALALSDVPNDQKRKRRSGIPDLLSSLSSSKSSTEVAQVAVSVEAFPVFKALAAAAKGQTNTIPDLPHFRALDGHATLEKSAHERRGFWGSRRWSVNDPDSPNGASSVLTRALSRMGSKISMTRTRSKMSLRSTSKENVKSEPSSPKAESSAKYHQNPAFSINLEMPGSSNPTAEGTPSSLGGTKFYTPSSRLLPDVEVSCADTIDDTSDEEVDEYIDENSSATPLMPPIPTPQPLLKRTMSLFKSSKASPKNMPSKKTNSAPTPKHSLITPMAANSSPSGRGLSRFVSSSALNRAIRIVKPTPAHKKTLVSGSSTPQTISREEAASLLVEAARIFELMGVLDEDHTSMRALERRLNVIALAETAFESYPERGIPHALFRGYSNAACFFAGMAPAKKWRKKAIWCAGAAKRMLELDEGVEYKGQTGEAHILLRFRCGTYDAMMGDLSNSAILVEKAVWASGFVSNRMQGDAQTMFGCILFWQGRLQKYQVNASRLAKQTEFDGAADLERVAFGIMGLAFTGKYDDAASALERVAQVPEGTYKSRYMGGLGPGSKLHEEMVKQRTRSARVWTAISILLWRCKRDATSALLAARRSATQLIVNRHQFRKMPLELFHTIELTVHAMWNPCAGNNPSIGGGNEVVELGEVRAALESIRNLVPLAAEFAKVYPVCEPSAAYCNAIMLRMALKIQLAEARVKFASTNRTNDSKLDAIRVKMEKPFKIAIRKSLAKAVSAKTPLIEALCLMEMESADNHALGYHVRTTLNSNTLIEDELPQNEATPSAPSPPVVAANAVKSLFARRRCRRSTLPTRPSSRNNVSWRMQTTEYESDAEDVIVDAFGIEYAPNGTCALCCLERAESLFESCNASFELSMVRNMLRASSSSSSRRAARALAAQASTPPAKRRVVTAEPKESLGWQVHTVAGDDYELEQDTDDEGDSA